MADKAKETLRWRRAVDQDVPRVFADLAPRFVDEYATALPVVEKRDLTRDEAVRAAKRHIRLSISSKSAETAILGSQPIALLWWTIREREIHTGFAAHERFFAREHLIAFRRHIGDLQVQLGRLPTIASNWSGRDDVDRWFKLLGYELQDEGPLVKKFRREPPQAG